MAYLVIVESGKKPIRHPLMGATTIGRAWDCDIHLNDSSVSQTHCCIEPVDDAKTEWAAVDLGSRNGTRLEGERISRIALKDGAVLRVGRVRVQFHAAGFVAERPKTPDSEPPPESPLLDMAQLSASLESRRADQPPRPLPVVRSPAEQPPAATTDRRSRQNARFPRPLAFAREPARPLVPEATVDIGAQSSPDRRWMTAAACVAALAVAAALAGILMAEEHRESCYRAAVVAAVLAGIIWLIRGRKRS